MPRTSSANRSAASSLPWGASLPADLPHVRSGGLTRIAIERQRPCVHVEARADGPTRPAVVRRSLWSIWPRAAANRWPCLHRRARRRHRPAVPPPDPGGPGRRSCSTRSSTASCSAFTTRQGFELTRVRRARPLRARDPRRRRVPSEPAEHGPVHRRRRRAPDGHRAPPRRPRRGRDARTDASSRSPSSRRSSSHRWRSGRSGSSCTRRSSGSSPTVGSALGVDTSTFAPLADADTALWAIMARLPVAVRRLQHGRLSRGHPGAPARVLRARAPGGRELVPAVPTDHLAAAVAADVHARAADHDRDPADLRHGLDHDRGRPVARHGDRRDPRLRDRVPVPRCRLRAGDGDDPAGRDPAAHGRGVPAAEPARRRW